MKKYGKEENKPKTQSKESLVYSTFLKLHSGCELLLLHLALNL